MRFSHFIALACSLALFSACYGHKGLPYIEDTDSSTNITLRDTLPEDTQPPATNDTNNATPATDDAGTSFSIDADGYVRSGVWHGYTDVLLNGAGTTAFPADFRGHPSQTPLCLSGVVAAVSDWNGNAQIRVRLQQDRAADAPPMPIAIEPYGLHIALSNPGNTELRVIIYPESGPSYCVVMPAKQTSATFYWEQFNTHCWNDSGTFYAMQPLTALAVLVPGHNIEPRPYDFCIESFSHHDEAPISHIDTDVDTGAPVDTDRIPKAWQHGFVGDNGALQVVGNQLHNKGGGPESEPIALQGLSLFWSQWGGKYYTKEVVNELTQHWNATAIRAALGVNGPSNGYLANPTPEVARVVTVVNAAIEAGIYVIIDWHDHHAHTHPYDARAFFEAMAQIYGDYPNVIYEIYNEPLNVSWQGTLKPYAEFIIEGIRQHDPDNLILVGTPVWSQQPDAAVGHSIDDPNVAYVFHFYAGMHSFGLRLKAEIALGTGLPVFISEWGLESGAFVDNDHHGEIRLDVLTPWLDWMKEKRLSHLMWSCYDKDEPMSILKAGASPLGGWTDDDLTPVGRFMKQYYNAPPPTPLDTDTDTDTETDTDTDTETDSDTETD